MCYWRGSYTILLSSALNFLLWSLSFQYSRLETRFWRGWRWGVRSLLQCVVLRGWSVTTRSTLNSQRLCPPLDWLTLAGRESPVWLCLRCIKSLCRCLDWNVRSGHLILQPGIHWKFYSAVCSECTHHTLHCCTWASVNKLYIRYKIPSLYILHEMEETQTWSVLVNTTWIIPSLIYPDQTSGNIEYIYRLR